jgi:hypothetical protein
MITIPHPTLRGWLREFCSILISRLGARPPSTRPPHSGKFVDAEGIPGAVELHYRGALPSCSGVSIYVDLAPAAFAPYQMDSAALRRATEAVSAAFRGLGYETAAPDAATHRCWFCFSSSEDGAGFLGVDLSPRDGDRSLATEPATWSGTAFVPAEGNADMRQLYVALLRRLLSSSPRC